MTAITVSGSTLPAITRRSNPEASAGPWPNSTFQTATLTASSVTPAVRDGHPSRCCPRLSEPVQAGQGTLLILLGPGAADANRAQDGVAATDQDRAERWHDRQPGQA